jgi:hypothetical protein
MRENAVRTAFDMQRRAQARQGGSLEELRRESAMRPEKPPNRDTTVPAPAQGTPNGSLPQFYRAAYGVEHFTTQSKTSPPKAFPVPPRSSVADQFFTTPPSRAAVPQNPPARPTMQRLAAPMPIATPPNTPPPQYAAKTPPGVAAPHYDNPPPQFNSNARQNQPVSSRRDCRQSTAASPPVQESFAHHYQANSAAAERMPHRTPMMQAQNSPEPAPSYSAQTQLPPEHTTLAPHDDTRFLLMLIMLLRQEGADGMLIVMLMYILM